MVVLSSSLQFSQCIVFLYGFKLEFVFLKYESFGFEKANRGGKVFWVNVNRDQDWLLEM